MTNKLNKNTIKNIVIAALAVLLLLVIVISTVSMKANADSIPAPTPVQNGDTYNVTIIIPVDTPVDTELIVPAPYDEVYLFWLQSKIDYWNGEMGKYNNSIMMYNQAYENFEKAYNREHKPISKKLKFF